MTDLVNMMREYAHENYWQDSWDIMVRWSDEQIAAAIAGAKTRRGAIAKAWGKIQILNAARRRRDGEVIFTYGDLPVKPVSLFEFLAACGGLKPHPDLQYILDGNPRIRRLGPLVRDTGRDLDRAREACVEAGYLQDAGAISGGVSESTINDLLEIIADEASGNKRYPDGEENNFPTQFEMQEQPDDCPF